MLEDWKRQLHLWRRQVVRPGTQQNMQALLVTQARRKPDTAQRPRT